MRTGIILAAGDATRLPNKPLLPLRNCQPVITSGIHLLRRSGCGRVVVVVPNESPLQAILSVFPGTTGLTFVEQFTANGVADALRTVLPHVGLDDELIVTFCDNVFTDEEVVPESPVEQGPFAAVRRLEPRIAYHLDKWVDNEWVYRSVTGVDACLAGWYRIFGHNLQEATPDRNGIEFLNAIGADAHFVDLPWWDIGTPAMYKEYWA